MLEAVGQIRRGVAREFSCFLICHVVGGELQVVVEQLTRLLGKGDWRRTLRTVGILLVCHYYCNSRQVCECVCSRWRKRKKKLGERGIYI